MGTVAPQQTRGQREWITSMKKPATSENNFGEIIRASGPMSKINPFRFSTKYCDDESAFVHYSGYRYYSSDIGRWFTRDPISERGGPNLYGFVNNTPISRIDKLGLTYKISNLNPPSGKWVVRKYQPVMVDDQGFMGFHSTYFPSLAVMEFRLAHARRKI